MNSAIKRASRILGITAILLGALWMAQGTGLFPYPASSFMIDQKPWIIYGAALALAGILLLRLGRRPSR